MLFINTLLRRFGRIKRILESRITVQGYHLPSEPPPYITKHLQQITMPREGCNIKELVQCSCENSVQYDQLVDICFVFSSGTLNANSCYKACSGMDNIFEVTWEATSHENLFLVQEGVHISRSLVLPSGLFCWSSSSSSSSSSEALGSS